MNLKNSRIFWTMTSGLLLTLPTTSPIHGFDTLGRFIGMGSDSSTPQGQAISLTLLGEKDFATTENKPDLKGNYGFLSPATFQKFFDTCDHGYLRLHREVPLRDSMDVTDRNARSTFCVKPHPSVKDGNLALSGTLSQLFYQLDLDTTDKTKQSKATQGKPTHRKFLDVHPLSMEISSYATVSVSVDISPADTSVKLSEKVLAHQLLKRMKYIPLSPIMNDTVFKVSAQEVGIPSIQGIEAALKVTSPGGKYIDETTKLTIKLLNANGVHLEQYGLQNTGFGFESLIVQPTQKARVQSEILSAPLTQATLPIIEGSSGPQITRLNLNFTTELEIGGLDKQLGELVRRAVITRTATQETLETLGITEHVKGILLYGPPGTGKTLIAKQIAKMLGVDKKCLITLAGTEILDKYIGEAERKVRDLFAVAKQNPKKLVVVFIDEIDSIGGARTNNGSASSSAQNNIVNQLLSEMDGANTINNILVIGATNRLDMIDPALLRPGRFEVQLNISLPDEAGRLDIFKIHLKKPIEKGTLKDISLEDLARRTHNYTGAEIKGLCNSARTYALQRAMTNPADLTKVDKEQLVLTSDDFESAFKDVKPLFGHDQEGLKTKLPNRDILLPSQQELVDDLLFKINSFQRGRVSSIVLSGDMGTGKSALAGLLVDQTVKTFDLTRIIAPTLPKRPFLDQLQQAWEQASLVDNALIVLDGLDRLLRLLSIYKYDEQALLMLSDILSAKPKGKVVILATMRSDGQRVLDLITDLIKFHEKPALVNPSDTDIKAILEKLGIHDTKVVTLLEGLPLYKVFDFLNVENPETKDYAFWVNHIARLKV